MRKWVAWLWGIAGSIAAGSIGFLLAREDAAKLYDEIVSGQLNWEALRKASTVWLAAIVVVVVVAAPFVIGALVVYILSPSRRLRQFSRQVPNPPTFATVGQVTIEDPHYAEELLGLSTVLMGRVQATILLKSAIKGLQTWLEVFCFEDSAEYLYRREGVHRFRARVRQGISKLQALNQVPAWQLVEMMPELDPSLRFLQDSSRTLEEQVDLPLKRLITRFETRGVEAPGQAEVERIFKDSKVVARDRLELIPQQLISLENVITSEKKRLHDLHSIVRALRRKHR